MLNLIDHLPRTSHFTAALVDDDEYAEMVARSAAATDSEAWTPPITTWTQEASMLATVIDRLAGIQHTLVAVNSPKGKTPRPPDPYPIPVTKLSKAVKRSAFLHRKAKHEALVARVLPNREAQ